jgi:hypothetical protein
VAKQVCQSATPADCASATGPWGPATIVPAGGTAFWRITVTNPTPVPLTGVTLTDAIETSCERGPFDLPASSTVDFFCSSAGLLATTTNQTTVLVPAQDGSPSGTPS